MQEALDTMHSFDYIEDTEGWIYVSRGVIVGTNLVVVEAMYDPLQNRLGKYRGESTEGENIPSSVPCPMAGDTQYLLYPKNIKKVFPRQEIEITDYDEHNELLNRINDIVSRHGAHCYLFGSRRLKIGKDDSDYDILVFGCMNPCKTVQLIAENLNGEVRRFSQQECSNRAIRYGYPNGPLSPEFLARIFSKTTMYLKTQLGEIGIFFASHNDSNIPNILKLHHVPEESIVGTIIPSGGASHLMPRQFFIETENNKIQRIVTVSWELGGIEENAGLKVRLAGVRAIRNNKWWFGGPKISLEILD